ncbi:MAG: 30S ribosomal protein S5 [Allopontixanthobacter sediminis]
MMADDKKTDETPAATPEATVEETKVQPETEAAPAAEAPVEAKEEAAPAADAPAEPVIDNAGSTPTPTMASTEAADNQSAAGGAPSQPRSGRGGGNNRGGGHGGQGGGQGGNRDGGRGGRGGRDGNRRGGRDDQPDDGLVEKLVHINRVSKTVKGGKRFGFAALVVVGDGAGRVGFGKGKAREVPEAITKATAAAKKKMIRVSLKEGRTLHHDGRGRFGAGKVAVRSAPAGTGIIAGGPMRAVFESVGVQDVVAKSVGTSNPYNMVRATFDALKAETSPRSVAARRGKKVSDIISRRKDGEISSD